jgi:hypothetical protein
MAHFINVASVRFDTRIERQGPESGQAVLRDVRAVMASLKGYGLDLVAFSEGVESIGMPRKDAEDLAAPGPFLTAYRDFAAASRCHVAGSVKLREGNRVYNSIAFIGRSGEILGAYHKVNLTVGEIEEGLCSGRAPVVVETDIGRLGGIICFDLNFEPLRHAYRALKPDILTFASAYHGGLAQGMWAYDCRSFFVSALPFDGGGILDPYGRPLALTDCYHAVARATVNLDRAMVHLDYNSEKFSAIEKKYLGEVVIDIPANVGSGLLYSLSDKRTALDVVREFELELLDDYFPRALRANEENRRKCAAG